MTRYIVKVPCPHCLGTGIHRRKPALVICTLCDGTGEVERSVPEMTSEGKAQ